MQALHNIRKRGTAAERMITHMEGALRNQANRDAQFMAVCRTSFDSAWVKACFLSLGVPAHRRGKLVYIPVQYRERMLQGLGLMHAHHPESSPVKVFDAGENGEVIYRA